MVEGKTIKTFAFILLAILFVLLISLHNTRLDAQRQEAVHYVTTTQAADKELATINERLKQFQSDQSVKAFQTLGYERVLNNDSNKTTFSKVNPYLKQTTAVTVSPANTHGLSRAIITVYDGDSTTLKQLDLTKITQLETVLSWKDNHAY